MRTEKKFMVKELEDAIRGVNPLIFTDYSKGKAKNLTELRTQLRAVNSKYKVVQNTLFKRAVESVGLTSNYNFQGPTAVALGGKDVVEVVKTLIKFVKDNPDTVIIKGGIVDRQYLELKGLEELSKLPSKDVLRAKIVSQLNSPIYGIANVLRANLQKVVCVLDGIAKKKQ